MSPDAEAAAGPSPRLPFVVGIALVALGSIVLIGWLGSIPFLTRLGPTLSPMQANTAVCFLLAGMALVVLRFQYRRLVFALGLVILLVSSIVFAQHATGLDLGIDRLLLGDAGGVPALGGSGRMAPNSAMAFMLAGISAMLLGRRRGSSTTALSGCIVLTLGASAILGFVVGADQAFGWGDLTRMSLLTALGLTALGASVVIEVLGRADGADERDSTPKRAALLAGTTAALLSLLLWHTLRVQQEDRLHATAERAASGLEREITRRIDGMIRALDRLAADATRSERRSLGRGRGAIGFAAADFIRFDWIDRRGQDWILLDPPSEPGTAAPPDADSALWRESLEALVESRSPVVSAPFQQPDGVVGLRIFVPIPDHRPGIAVSGLVPVEDAFGVPANRLTADYGVTILRAGRKIFEDRTRDALAGSTIERELDLAGPASWRVVMAPTPSLLSRQRGALPELVLFGGLVIAVLLGSTVWFGGISNRQAERLRAAVRERTAELETALESVRSENEERRRSEQTLARTQRVSQMVSAERDLMKLVQAVTDAARELTGAAWGAFLYNLTDERGESYMLYTLSGIPVGAFEGYPMPRSTELFRPTFHGEGPVRCDDVRKDARYGHNAPHRGVPHDHPLDVVSYLAVPVVSRSGSVWGGLLFGHPEAGVFGEDAEAIAVSLAAQTAIAMDNLSLLDAERNARAEAQEASVAKDRFLSVVSHELRNPLGSIRSALDVLEGDPDDPDAEARMRAILLRQVQQLARLVDDLLDVSRVVSGKLSVHVERVDLALLVGRVVDAARTRLAGGRRLELSAGDESAWVDADPARITQTLDNLIVNAERHTDENGAIQVRVVANEARERVRVTVRDDGRGIDSNEMSQLFEPFYQNRKGPEREAVGGGLGLGLAICRGVIEAHAGELSASSAGPGRGAEFTFDLPLRTPPPQDSTPSGSPSSPEGKRVLVIDDHEDSLVALAELLRLEGHDVEAVGDGRSGIEAARRRSPHLVICDIGMPEVDGYEVARALRSDARTASLRLVALTGYGDDDAVRRALDAGFDRHMTKPVDPSLLRDLLVDDGG